MEEYEKKYIETQKEEIRFKVLGENKTNEFINYITPKLLKYFKDEIGKQVLKKGCDFAPGYLLKKHKDKTDIIIKQAEEKFDNKDYNFNAYLSCSCYSVILEIKLRFNTCSDRGFLYYNNNKYILDLEYNTAYLKRLFEFKAEKEINDKEQIKSFFKCLELKKQFEEIKSNLKPYNLRELVK